MKRLVKTDSSPVIFANVREVQSIDDSGSPKWDSKPDRIAWVKNQVTHFTFYKEISGGQFVEVNLNRGDIIAMANAIEEIEGEDETTMFID